MIWQRAVDVQLLPKLVALARAGVARSPDAAEAWLRLGELQGYLGNAEAGASLDKALTLAAHDPDMLCGLAADLLRLSERDRALAAAEAALVLAPGDAQVQALRLRCLLATHSYAEAYRCLEEARQIALAYPGVLGMHDEQGVPPERMLGYCEE